MDAARIHYAKTSDGLNIAYCASGNGPPLVMLPPMPFNHCQLSLEFSEMQSWLERISRRLMIVHTIDDARTLAAGIKNAQMTLLPDNTVAPYLGDTKSVIE